MVKRADLLQQAIASVAKQKLPYGCRMEIIVVNDRATDDTSKRVRELQKRYDKHIPVKLIETSEWDDDIPAGKDQTISFQSKQFPQDAFGCGLSRNCGIAVANTGRIRGRENVILCLDSDDLLQPGFMEETITYLRNNPDTPLVYTNQLLQFYGRVLAGDRFGLWKAPLELLERYLRPNFIPPQMPIQCSSVVFRKEFFDEYGYFWEKPQHEDSELWYRACAMNPNLRFGYITDPLSIFRIGATAEHNLGIASLGEYIRYGRELLKAHTAILQDNAQKFTREEVQEQKALIRESYHRLDELAQVFRRWQKGMLTKEEVQKKKGEIFAWVQYPL